MRRPHRIFSAILATTLAFFLGGCFSKETDTGINPEPNPITQSSWVQNPDSEAATRPHCGNVDDKIAGTLEGSGGAVGLIAGVRWGEATLTLQNGDEYRLNYKGLRLLDLGISEATFTGTVYNLSRIEDVIGTYYGAASGFGLVAGKGEVIVNNSHCVVIKALSTTEGVQLSPPGPGGFTVQLAPDE
ncbi:MAG: hypothetical protein R3322_01700 [Kiloniellales bacterium]|nr:hypothetical protein [Kiloniellales bacterium]